MLYHKPTDDFVKLTHISLPNFPAPSYVPYFYSVSAKQIGELNRSITVTKTPLGSEDNSLASVSFHQSVIVRNDIGVAP